MTGKSQREMVKSQTLLGATVDRKFWMNHNHPRPEGIQPVKEKLLVIIPCLNDLIFQLFLIPFYHFILFIVAFSITFYFCDIFHWVA